MNDHLVSDILEILSAGVDMAVATTFPDGRPHVVTVSFVSDGLVIYFGCSPGSQKAQNLRRDPRVAVAMNLPYEAWEAIRGLSLVGSAEPLLDASSQARAGALFLKKFPEISNYAGGADETLAIFSIRPEVIGVLDYRRGFGHVEHVRVVELHPPTTAPLASGTSRLDQSHDTVATQAAPVDHHQFGSSTPVTD